MESARLIAFYSKVHIEGSMLKLEKFGLFPWEKESDYAPRFSELDKEAFERMNAIQFPSDN
jgi:hypothetical protein